MLDSLGMESLEGLLAAVVPDTIYLDRAPALDEGADPAAVMSEPEVLDKLRSLAAQNSTHRSMIGMGYSSCHIPSPIRRLILESPSWYTAYTPYQPEISQGRLAMLFVFQTMVADLCAMDVANASLLDEATAAAEAMTMLRRANPKAGSAFLVDSDTHPQTLAVLATRAKPLGINLLMCDAPEDFLAKTDAFGALLSNPGSSGIVRDRTDLITRLAEAKIRTAVCTDLLSQLLYKAPGEMGAAIAIGSTQRFGMPMGAGGPHAAFIAFAMDLVRKSPGRLVGAAADTAGRTAYRLALQTREQHIRRERATSNICTAQTLPAVVAAAYAVYHGSKGLKAIAHHVHDHASSLAMTAGAAGLVVAADDFFDTVRIEHSDPKQVAQQAAESGIDLRIGDGWISASCDETTTLHDIDVVLKALGIAEPAVVAPAQIDAKLRRKMPTLEHEVFKQNRSEHAFMRLLRRLSGKDIALDRSMIPLGSCTMKLNAATQMQMITEPSWANLHPFAPRERLAGMNELADDLGKMLTRMTGFDAISFQPNSGAQGEYAGLLAIRGYHEANGDPERDICLIPTSAHGTNPASAEMAGMNVVSVDVDNSGGVLLDDLQYKLATHEGKVAALMVTYPSTSGIFTANIAQVCDLIHEAGGQVYMDGANMNALTGAALPGKFGPDVMHLNLHKTFCIPHGGGGPGMGPIVCREHLRNHLPGHPCSDGRNDGAVSSAPLGSGCLLAISWSYMRLLGASGLRSATAVAVLSANYMAKRLQESFPQVFGSSGALVAHEVVLDLSQLKKSTGVTVEDVAKRLIDMGFHSPTVAFPIPDCLMIEPTESEPLDEIDRFCEAIEAIRAEIRQLEEGEVALEDSMLRNAPHPAQDLFELAAQGKDVSAIAYPLEWLRQDKYWPPVSRVDQVAGDRKLRATLELDEKL